MTHAVQRITFTQTSMARLTQRIRRSRMHWMPRMPAFTWPFPRASTYEFPRPRFVLLVGDASWDTKNATVDEANYANWVGQQLLRGDRLSERRDRRAQALRVLLGRHHGELE